MHIHLEDNSSFVILRTIQDLQIPTWRNRQSLWYKPGHAHHPGGSREASPSQPEALAPQGWQVTFDHGCASSPSHRPTAHQDFALTPKPVKPPQSSQGDQLQGTRGHSKKMAWERGWDGAGGVC